MSNHIIPIGFGDFATDAISFVVTLGFGNWGGGGGATNTFRRTDDNQPTGKRTEQ